MSEYRILVGRYIKHIYFDSAKNLLQIFLDRGDAVEIQAILNRKLSASPENQLELQIRRMEGGPHRVWPGDDD